MLFGFGYVPHASLTIKLYLSIFFSRKIHKGGGRRVKVFSGEGDSRLIFFSVSPEPRVLCGKFMSHVAQA